MRYVDAARFLFALRHYEMRPGTDSTAALLAELGDPQDGPAYVQIAGSNGKGSTARMCESILREAGLDVGLYTSPHLNVVRDRICINGQPIPKRDVTAYVEAITDYVTDATAAGTPPTYFEAVTALALWYFGRNDVDVAVLEVGIGGPKDATSVIDPVASAVTSVSLEHTDVLGDSIEDIAREKAGVVPADNPLVTGTRGTALSAIVDEVETLTPVRLATTDPHPCESTHSPIVVTPTPTETPYAQGLSITSPAETIDTILPLLGSHQAVNAGIATALTRQLEGVDTTAIKRGLQGATFPGRFDVIADAPLVVLDGAHNPGACSVLAKTLETQSFDDLYIVFGAMRDKDHPGMLDALPPATHVTVSAADIPRAAEPTVLAKLARDHLAANISTTTRVEAALESTLQRATPRDCVLVTGSLATVREARHRWTRPLIPKQGTTTTSLEAVLSTADISPASGQPDAASLAHQVIQTSFRPRDASQIQSIFHTSGGQCLLSGLTDQDEEPIDVILSGSTAQFQDLIDRLEAMDSGFGTVASRIRRLLESPDDVRGESGESPAIMGILNVTPDSFHDGGSYDSIGEAVSQARAMADAGASIIDIGGESTRPGADPVTPTEERERVLPIIERLAELDVALSIDTRRAGVAADALAAGADIINDVSGLEDPAMAQVVADANASIVIMHSLDAPVVPDRFIAYDDVVHDVLRDLTESVLRAERAGLDRSQIIIDPGLGFGKSPRESFSLLGRVGEFRGLGCPILIGHSHKSMFELIDCGPDDRTAPTIAATAIGVNHGVDIVRVHDVAENVAAMETMRAARGESR